MLISTRFRSLFMLLAALLILPACDDADPNPMPDDTTPPAANNASASSNGAQVSINFNEDIDPSSVSAANFSVSPGGVSVTNASASGSRVTATLSNNLDDEDEMTYTMSYNGIRDLAGNTASGSVTFTYGGDGGGGSASQNLGAAYPNAGDNRINIFNTDGDRFLLFNPTTGAVTDADDLDDVENGADGGIPLSSVGAAASVFSDEETVFFAADGDTFTKYERDQSDFDAPASFEEEYDEFGYDLDGVGAAFGSNGERIIIFNRNGTQWQEWYTGSDGFTNVFSFPADFGDGSAPISSVGAAFYVEEDNEIYLVNRQGTQYTIFSSNGFTAAFPVSELGNFDF